MIHQDPSAPQYTPIESGGFIPVKSWGLVPYPPVFEAMKQFTEARTPEDPDEIWVCEHTSVFTLGLAGDPGHLLQRSNIPLVQTDRGGQITYHGPGQVVVYPLLNLHHYGLKVREYVNLLEQAIIDSLVAVGVADAQRKPGAPGVYTWRHGQLAKVAALGIKIRKGCTYHGLSLNVDMDLTPFTHINPCGYAGLETVDLRTIGVKISLSEMQLLLVKNLQRALDQARSAGSSPVDPPAY
ncbi:MAG TPA: lipoyl(octanoyl) transferase LipB [Limnobacter sp.]|uniref:lipoyl(octanoyl) transferase LipB n=1 Tax=Limnobacter sp. TaxID=2003368 RepID=UPI002ED8EF20